MEKKGHILEAEKEKEKEKERKRVELEARLEEERQRLAGENHKEKPQFRRKDSSEHFLGFFHHWLNHPREIQIMPVILWWKFTKKCRIHFLSLT
jgi:hypothetical protein